MDHHSHMGAVKCASLEQQDFAAGVPDLFGGRADYSDGQARFVGYSPSGDSCADGGRRNDVMATGVTDTRQSVVLSTDRYVEGPVP
jgi:hypothetical protein